jgi:hypothetical protein
MVMHQTGAGVQLQGGYRHLPYKSTGHGALQHNMEGALVLCERCIERYYIACLFYTTYAGAAGVPVRSGCHRRPWCRCPAPPSQGAAQRHPTSPVPSAPMQCRRTCDAKALRIISCKTRRQGRACRILSGSSGAQCRGVVGLSAANGHWSGDAPLL